ncbi:MAG: hypothetical protein V4495_11235 [Pseudomonadota bacterium]
MTIILGVMLVFFALVSLASRYSLSYWMCAAAIVLPIVAWRTSKFKLTAAIFLLVGILLAISPVDFVYKPGQVGLHLLPTSSGLATLTGTVGYGCIARNIPPWALVLSF